MSELATPQESPETIKQKIIDLFNRNVKGKRSDTTSSNQGHDGRGGHWLETQMGVKHNAKNEPDLWGFEMKNNTSTKTTFGDWSASYYIYKDKDIGISRTQFMEIFGSPNAEKDNRYSWSGKPTPKIDAYNSFGQILKIDAENNIYAYYSYSKDQRAEKSKIVPKNLQKELVVLATWSKEKMRKKVEAKFNKLGWFKCNKGSEGIYSSISFGPPINFEFWIAGVRKGDIFFDSGMYVGNYRNYSQWRASNRYWENLMIENY